MNKVRYQLIADPEISIVRLVFEHARVADSNKRSDTLDASVVGALTVDFECLASDLKSDHEWKLFVWVDDRPIKTANQLGYITDRTDASGKSSHYDGYEW